MLLEKILKVCLTRAYLFNLIGTCILIKIIVDLYFIFDVRIYASLIDNQIQLLITLPTGAFDIVHSLQ